MFVIVGSIVLSIAWYHSGTSICSISFAFLVGCVIVWTHVLKLFVVCLLWDWISVYFVIPFLIRSSQYRLYSFGAIFSAILPSVFSFGLRRLISYITFPCNLLLSWREHQSSLLYLSFICADINTNISRAWVISQFFGYSDTVSLMVLSQNIKSPPFQLTNPTTQ